ncbi:MAG TPA: hypothetical protein RMG48_00250, partial [Myxococcales bacterium LLY-WYZ-16_1]|nr:hypothetical protein [Myxococcales bacterium LLY-WYZ-16_1]
MFEQNSGDLVPGQNVPPGAPVLETRPIECAYGFDVTSLAVGGVLEFEHRRMGAVLQTDSLNIQDGTETIFLITPLEANDQVAVRQTAPAAGGGQTSPSVWRSFPVEAVDDAERAIELEVEAPALCADISVFTSVPTKVDLTITNGSMTQVRTLRAYRNRSYGSGKDNPTFMAVDFARESLGEGARVEAEVSFCGIVQSARPRPSTLEKIENLPAPQISNVVLYDSSRIEVTYTGKRPGARVVLLVNGIEEASTYRPSYRPGWQQHVFSATVPGVTAGDQVQLLQRYCAVPGAGGGGGGGTPSPPVPLPTPVPDPTPSCGSLGTVLPDGPVSEGAESIVLARPPSTDSTVYVFDDMNVQIGLSSARTVALTRPLVSGESIRLLLVGASGCPSVQVVRVEVLPASCAVPTVPVLPVGQFEIEEVEEFRIEDANGASPNRVVMPAYDLGGTMMMPNGIYELDDPVVGRAVWPSVAGNIPNDLPVVIFVHGICPNLPGDFASLGGYRVLQRALAQDGVASFSLVLRNCDSKYPGGPWRALLMERFVDFLLRMPVAPGAQPLPDDPFQGQLQGKLDLSNLLLVGHSTGFEGIAQYLVRRSPVNTHPASLGVHPSVGIRGAVGLGGWFLEPYVVDPTTSQEVAEWNIDRSHVLSELDDIPLLMLLGSEEPGYLSDNLGGMPNMNQRNAGAALHWLLHRDRAASLTYIQLPDGNHDEWNSRWPDPGAQADSPASLVHLRGAAPILRRWARLLLLNEPQQAPAFDGRRTTLDRGPYTDYLVFHSPAVAARSDLFHPPFAGPIVPAPGVMGGMPWSKLVYEPFASPDPLWENASDPLVGVASAAPATISFGTMGWFQPAGPRYLQVDGTSSGEGASVQPLVGLPNGEWFPLRSLTDSYLHPTS